MRRCVVVIAAIALASLGCAAGSSLEKEAAHPTILPPGEFATDPEVVPVLWQMFDIRTARRSHVPVYVVTRNAISKTSGGSPEMVLSGDWRR